MPTPSSSDAVLESAKRAQAQKKRNTIKVSLKPRNSGTLTARPQVFAARVAQFAKEIGDVGFKSPSEASYWPFANKALSDLYSKYDTLARAFIFLARQYQGKGVIISGNQGTAPELALLGAHLATGAFHFGVNLFHQSVPLYGLRARGRPFIVDCAASYGGVLFLYPVDGEYFHLKSMQEVLDSQRRNWELETVGGRVVPVTDVQCYTGMGLILYLRAQGAPI